MKLFRLTLIPLLLFICSAAWGQVQLTFSVENVQLLAGNTKLVYEVHILASTAGTHHIGGNIYMKYNTASFGSNISANSKVTVFDSTLLDKPTYTLSATDFDADVISINWVNFIFNLNPDPNFHIEVPTVRTPLLKVEIDNINPAVTPVIEFEQNLMDGKFTWLRAAFDPVVYTNVFSNSGLPVEWISFTADRLDSRNIQLRWETATEYNNDYFLVQRSVDGVLFEDLGKVSGAGTTDNPTTYGYLDNTYQANVNYYRLKQVDFNGSHTFSNIVEVRFDYGEDDIAFHLFPSPAKDQVTVQALGKLTKVYSIKIFDQTGRTVYLGELDKDSPKQKINVSDLTEGIYNYEVINNLEIKKSGRFLKIQN